MNVCRFARIQINNFEIYINLLNIAESAHIMYKLREKCSTKLIYLTLTHENMNRNINCLRDVSKSVCIDRF